MMGEIEVLQPGLFSTIQDYGRMGFQKYGVPLSGAMDTYAAKTANLVLRNKVSDAVLEITQMGPKLKFHQPAKIAIAGADLSPRVEGRAVAQNSVVKINSGEVLSFGRRKIGCRAYLAVKGGFKTESIFESRSWYEGITTYFKLEKGLKLAFEANEKEKAEINAGLKPLQDYIRSGEIEVYPGPEYDVLCDAQKLLLEKTEYGIGKNNNRMAIQLAEPLVNELDAIITGPVLPGTVQLTPSGKMIVLMKDAQTTGGYPRILQLSEKGMNALAQKVMGDRIKFKLRPY
ncbi:biotin-dependent carboxyltransferase family protein [Zunongwangia sp. F363]|uniref:Biotin-dependent carboxyltransferase family protein n=1 Tax=Autumnicola tepida TaxID=3075595 RepID=A0ABU3CDA5_9FLAO|nr:biotin-dependent carboxyltransferase family protein [Zunongwangia sp. F363]MDT0644331.1 biotin-dependent carboxyltransferase family protein [Zunongwangia sp. F363]